MLAIRSLLSDPHVYRTFWKAVGGPGYIKVFVEEYVRPSPGARILDIGCGPGTTLPYLPNTEYVGFDISPTYIESARRHFPHATFVCERISDYTLPQACHFDVVLALGIIHHLDDAEARQLCDTAYRALKVGGKLVTFDGVLTENQSRWARYLVTRDRGEYVRNAQGYLQIASQVFPNVRSTVRHDLLRIPYSHMIMECVR